MKATVLVVEDDTTLRRVIQLALTREGYDVMIAANGQQALTRVSERRPALILLDLHLPVMDGSEVLARLRAQGVAIPVVLMTSRFAIREAADLHQPDGVLGTPFDLDELRQVVARFLGGPRA
jgi:CheY-like chemotaxis protein